MGEIWNQNNHLYAKIIMRILKDLEKDLKEATSLKLKGERENLSQPFSLTQLPLREMRLLWFHFMGCSQHGLNPLPLKLGRIDPGFIPDIITELL